MKKTIILAMFAALCTLTAGCADDFKTVLNDKYYEDDTPSREPDITEQTLTLGSYNLWISSKGTGDYLWTNRRTVLAQSIVKNKWDIFGFQEANGTIQNELPTLVGQQGGKYEWWFVGRDSQDGVSGEALGIAYNPERFELTDKHFFWISPTPDEMSYGWDELGYHRIAACAMVTDKLYNKQFFMMVTHAPLGATARAEGAKLLIEREKMYNPDGIPSILVGDMNAAMDDASSKTLRTHWNDSFLTVESDFVSGPVGTFNGHKITADLTQATARIDYIYSRGDVELKSYKVDNTVYGNIYPSDHCPLTIQFDTDYEKPAPDVVEGSGTAADPWQLNSVSDWNTVAASINGQAEDAVYTSAAYYRLTADIDFDNKNLTPISFTADNTIYFEGEFDGAGHKLLNVKIVAPGKSCGVFGANKGTIRDLAVEGALSTEFEIAGGIVGINAGVIDGATFKGDITGGEGAKTIGGIAGQNKGTLVNCANLGGTMKTDAPKDPNMGGIVGQIAKGGDGLGPLCHQLLQPGGQTRSETQRRRRHRRHRQRRQLRHQLLLDRGKDHSQQLLRIGGGLQQERQPAEHLRQLGMSVQVCGELRRRQRQGGRNGLEKDDLRPALARRDEVGRRHRTFERRVVRKLRRSAQRRRGALQRHSGGNAAGQARRRPAQVDGIGELSRTGKITLQENRNFPVLPF